MSWRTPTTCWAADETTKVIPVEAETPSDAVFLATHSSIPIFERDMVTNAKRVKKTDESALLKAVREQPADQPILPILGGSGTGKSHLVRWLRATLPMTDSRRVVFVPKHRMSLRGILDLVLEGITSERATELRQKVATAVEGIADEQEAKLRLKSALAVLVEVRGKRTDVPSEEQELREWLASSGGLSALLGDPVFRERLFDSKSPISRLVREKLTGRGIEDKEEAFGFSPDDLALSVDDIARAGEAAQSVAAALMNQAERELAATMLNEQLNSAVSQVFGIGGEDLKELLVEVRVELEQQNQELLLLIEDFSIFQGIQGGLLDAITLIPTQDNGVCPMRIVMAVTSGYFIKQMPDTVYTRVYKVFDLDSPTPQVTFAPATVAARYMNAIRVGSKALDNAHKAGDERPNACEQCPVNESCHAAFGAVDGYGLFPFNQHALDKAVRSRLVEERLSLRDFLTQVLRPVLFNQHDEIEHHTFPNASFDAAFRSGAVGDLDSIEDEHRLATSDVELSRRRIVLVRYWGASGSGPQNLAPAIHEAFGIPPVEGLHSDVPTLREPAPTLKPLRQPPSPPVPPQKSILPRLVQAVDGWRSKGLLIQGNRNELRRLVHGAVVLRLSFDDGLGGTLMWTDAGKQWDSAFGAQTAIGFADQANPDAIITLDPKNDEDVRTLRALAWVNDQGDWRSLENGEFLQRFVEEKVSAWSELVTAALLPARDTKDDPELEVAANTLLTMSKALGVSDAFREDALTRTQALFAPAPSVPHASRPRLQQWQKVVVADPQRLSRNQLQQRVLRLASFTQGPTGSPIALDLPRVIRALRGRDAASDLPASTGLLEDTANTVRTRLTALSGVRDEAGALLPDISNLGGELADVAKRIDMLVAERAKAGQLPGGIIPSDLRNAGRVINPGDAGRVQSIGSRLRTWTELSVDQQIRLLTDDWDEPVDRVATWLKLASQAVRALEENLGSGTNTAAQLEYNQARQALIDSLQAAAGFLSTAQGSEETT
ncbi:protein DpdH [Gordonia sp. NPDC062954]|uniref:protein DpdH n=1 Tax=Gordonia sp. NPDC062954 TaxID=3364003 RepID=UPI0037CCBF74